jgi:uncharacterized coiled-coil DUF342 family protein
MNDTPITDANRLPDFDRGGDVVLADVAAELERALTAVTEQRDGLRSGIDYASDQLSKVTEQRDRLAEALQECREDSGELLGERDWWQNEPRLDYQKRYQETRDNATRADEALQYLTTNYEQRTTTQRV